MDQVREVFEEVFRDVFDDPTLDVTDDMTADDVDGWDSLTHINLIIALEKRFKIKFATAEISRLKDEGSNVGSIIALVERKVGAPT